YMSYFGVYECLLRVCMDLYLLFWCIGVFIRVLWSNIFFLVYTCLVFGVFIEVFVHVCPILVYRSDGEDTFNRAKLLNVGYAEALKEYDYNCFVFSDVDLVPVDDRNIYRCFDQPRHLAVSMDKFGFRLPYNQYFGGVSAMSKEQFLKINGFPNNYWGWGGEDDDIYNRLTYRGMSVSRPDGVIGRCKMIQHNRDKMNEPNPQRFDRIARTRQTINTDGINTLTYTVVKTEKDKLFTKIIVDIGKP
uniref:UDP-Gal:betaGlcNAc beta 1,4- galactosyltransferase, polypeptide 1 n=1 Tax=Astyanax mexicanus TaxID=7994 RepID=A0A8B9H2X8_ASTMX